MRACLINDCTGFVGIAPCCLDCPDRNECPDRCDRWIDRKLETDSCDEAYELGWEDLMTEISIARPVVEGETE